MDTTTHNTFNIKRLGEPHTILLALVFSVLDSITNNRYNKYQIVRNTIIQFEYSCAVTPQVRQTGNRLSGLAGTAYASLLT